METVIVIGKRPTKIPLHQVDRAQQSTSNGDQLIGYHWIICNAPRPIVGHVEWRGEFTSGIFYAAIDPAGVRWEWMLKENESQHAVVLVYWTVFDVRLWLQRYYEAKPEVDMADVRALTDLEAIEAFRTGKKYYHAVVMGLGASGRTPAEAIQNAARRHQPQPATAEELDEGEVTK